jgi:RNA polymerase sigma-70 factor (ECF subfamily)
MSTPAGDPLTRGLAAGRDEAFAAAYDRFGPALYRAAVTLLGSRADAEDAVQDVFVGLARAGSSLAAVENLRAYLFTALRHAAAKAAARPTRCVPLPDPDTLAAPAARSVAVETAARLEQALAALPAEQRKLVALKVDGELTFQEVAACLGISPNTAASRYRYALEKLRAALGEAGHDP